MRSELPKAVSRIRELPLALEHNAEIEERIRVMRMDA